MIDNFSLLLTHSLLLLAAWRFMRMAERDPDEAQSQGDSASGWGRRR